MNTIMKFLRDERSIFSSVSVIRKQIARAIATKGALKFSYALPVIISTTQFEESQLSLKEAKKVSTAVLHNYGNSFEKFDGFPGHWK
jgi:hypothetical protein